MSVAEARYFRPARETTDRVPESESQVRWKAWNGSIVTGIAYPRSLNLQSLDAAGYGVVFRHLESLTDPALPDWLALRRLGTEMRLRSDDLITAGLENSGARVSWPAGVPSIGFPDLDPATTELFNVLVVLVEDKVLDSRPASDCESFDDLVARELLLLRPLHMQPDLAPHKAVESLTARLAAIVGRRLNQGEQWTCSIEAQVDEDGVLIHELESLQASDAACAFAEIELQMDLERNGRTLSRARR